MASLRIARVAGGCLLAGFFVFTAPTAIAQPIPDAFASSIASGGAPILTCPLGDAPGLSVPNAAILVRVRDASGQPILNLVPGDFEVDGAPLWMMADVYFPGPNTHNVMGLQVVTPGDYLLNSPLMSGGNGFGLEVKVRNVLIVTGAPVPNPFVSPDITGDGIVNLSDIGTFAQFFYGGFNPSADFNFDGVLNLADIGILAVHNGCVFPPGGVADVD